MEDYKVWDIEGECWIPDCELAIKPNGSMMTRIETEEFSEAYFIDDIEVTIHRCIGKDSFGNKIYSESSIVEFEHFYMSKTSTELGYFKYNENIFGYQLLSPIFNTVAHRESFSKLKVVGTMQEDSELIKVAS